VTDAIATLKAIEAELFQALDAADTGLVTDLVAARGRALDALRQAYDALPPERRHDYLGDLQQLAAGDAVLGRRCRELRDTLQARLQQDAPRAPRSQTVVSGVFDRQA
jgi:hypothetical protein